MPRSLKIGAVVLLVVVAVVAAIPFLVDANQFRGIVQSQLESATGRKVTLGEMSLRLFPLSLRVDKLEIADDPAFAQAPFLTAARMDVQVAAAPLLRRQVQVESVRVESPVVELIKNAKGDWNFSTLGGKSGESSSGQQGIALGLLALRAGTVGITDHSKPGKAQREAYQDIDLLLRDVAPGKPFLLETSMRLPNGGAFETRVAAAYDQASKLLRLDEITAELGALRADGKGSVDLSRSPSVLDLAVNANNAPLRDLAKLGSFPADTKIDGTLAAQVKVTGPTDAIAINGTLVARNVEVLQKGWQQPVRTPELKVLMTPDALRTEQFTVQSGQTKLLASATVSDYATKPRIAAQLRANDARIEELLRVAAAYGVKTANEIDGKGRITLDVRLSMAGSDVDYQGSGLMQDATIQLPALTKPIEVKTAGLRFAESGVDLENLVASLAGSTVRGFLKVRNFTAPRLDFDAAFDKLDVAEWQSLSKASSPQTSAKTERPLANMTGGGKLRAGTLNYGSVALSNVSATVTIDRGLLVLDPIEAGLFGGSQVGAITADFRPDPAQYSIKTRLEKVDANKLLSSTTAIKNVVFGALGGEASLSVAPKEGEDFAKAMSGNLRFQLGDGKLGGVQVLNEVAKVAKFAGVAVPVSGEPVTDILGFSGSLDIQQGKATTNDLKLAFAGGSLEGAGTLGLVDQSLQMKVLSMLDSSTSERLGGSRIGGYLSTALANAKGELVIPCLVSGSAAKPVFTPDPAEFARLKVKGIFSPQTGQAIGGAVLDAIRGGGKKKEGEDGASAPAGIGGGLLDVLRGGGKKKQQ